MEDVYEIKQIVIDELSKSTDREYASQIADSIIGLVCKDIKETADKEWNDCDVRLAIGRVLVNLVCTDTSGAKSFLESIYDKVADNDGEMDLSDIEFSWTWFDDEGNVCGVSKAERLFTDTDCNGCTVVMVEFDDRTECIDSLDYYDVVGTNFVESLFLEIC